MLESEMVAGVGAGADLANAGCIQTAPTVKHKVRKAAETLSRGLRADALAIIVRAARVNTRGILFTNICCLLSSFEM